MSHFTTDQWSIVLATPAMLTLLQRATTWYIDGTFQVITRPFQQLLSIHAYVKRGGTMKHVPLCYVVMSQRRKLNYEPVLRHLVNMLPNLELTDVMSDFVSVARSPKRH